METENKEDKFAPKYEFVEGYVVHCVVCGEMWAGRGDTGEEITCGHEKCGAKFKVFKV